MDATDSLLDSLGGGRWKGWGGGLPLFFFFSVLFSPPLFRLPILGVPVDYVRARLYSLSFCSQPTSQNPAFSHGVSHGLSRHRVLRNARCVLALEERLSVLRNVLQAVLEYTSNVYSPTNYGTKD